MSTAKKKRNANIELLRMISMLMVTFLHALGKSNLLVGFLPENMANANTWIAWVIELLCIGAVNIFMLISGYFLVESEFKIGRLIELIAQTLFYTLGSFGIGCVVGLVDSSKIDVYSILNYAFPIHMEVFWFISAYVLIYIFQPIIAKGIKAISQKQLQLIILLALIYECFMKSFLPVRFSGDTKGYSFLWYLIVFIIGAYFRLYGFKVLNKPYKGILVYFAGAAVNLPVLVGVQHIYIYKGHLTEIVRNSLEYNHVLVLLISVGIFSAFVNMKEKDGKAARVICALSPMALGVYMCHENMVFRYEWQKWFGLAEASNKDPIKVIDMRPIGEVSPGVFIARLVLSVVVVYCVGTLIDFIRIQIFKLVKTMFGKNKS